VADYCDRDDIEDVFGVGNVAKWADLDNDEDSTKIAARIARAVTAAMADVDSRMLGGPYTVPLAKADASIPTLVTDVCARLAGVWLYENHGVQDYDAEKRTAKHRLSFHKDEAHAVLDELRASRRRIDAVPAATTRPYVHDHYTQVADDSDLTSKVRQGET
jgi:hypothetical protein